MALRRQWSGTGTEEALLFIPGWNTPAATVQCWLPESFLAKHRCGVLEWPVLGKAVKDPLPVTLDAFLDELGPCPWANDWYARPSCSPG